jgi:D,D-heptose 1,7-bisphosphate phosphatase
MKAFLFDRDGTLNIDTGYINNPDEMKLFPSVPEVLRKLKEKNYLIFILSNQSGIGRGLISSAEYRKVHEKFISLFGDSIIDDVLFCPHRPEQECNCRKPGTLLLEVVDEQYQIDWRKSYFVGDKKTDMLCGKNFNMITVLVADELNTAQQQNKKRDDGGTKPDIIIPSISELLTSLRL